MIKWTDFAKRRKLNLEDFITNYTYEQYQRWCEYRSVIPVSQGDFTFGSIKSSKEPPIENPAVVYTNKQLNKMKKAELVSLAGELDIDLDGSETKKIIVSLIQSL